MLKLMTNLTDKIYQEKTNGIRIRSKCDWYEHGEKSSKFCLNYLNR